MDTLRLEAITITIRVEAVATRNKEHIKGRMVEYKLLLGARTLLGAPGLTTRSKDATSLPLGVGARHSPATHPSDQLAGQQWMPVTFVGWEFEWGHCCKCLTVLHDIYDYELESNSYLLLVHLAFQGLLS